MSVDTAMKNSEKHYYISDFSIERRQHGAVVCFGEFGVAIFQVDDLAFLEELHARRDSSVTTTTLIELYSVADGLDGGMSDIADFLAARKRMTSSGVLLECAA